MLLKFDVPAPQIIVGFVRKIFKNICFFGSEEEIRDEI